MVDYRQRSGGCNLARRICLVDKSRCSARVRHGLADLDERRFDLDPDRGIYDTSLDIPRPAQRAGCRCWRDTSAKPPPNKRLKLAARVD